MVSKRSFSAPDGFQSTRARIPHSGQLTGMLRNTFSAMSHSDPGAAVLQQRSPAKRCGLGCGLHSNKLKRISNFNHMPIMMNERCVATSAPESTR